LCQICDKAFLSGHGGEALLFQPTVVFWPHSAVIRPQTGPLLQSSLVYHRLPPTLHPSLSPSLPSPPPPPPCASVLRCPRLCMGARGSGGRGGLGGEVSCYGGARGARRVLILAFHRHKIRARRHPAWHRLSKVSALVHLLWKGTI
jgi:hypothetical protein